ncbi:transcriptional repressor [Candidatus Saccharibacteria bacterium]|nr:transcriptional repressor [Candidatus Saccharibacteria bacterium]
MRNSKQSETIKANVMGRYDHPTAAMVYESVRREMPNVSLGTVYRNLDRLVANDEILRISVPNQADRFDATISEHYHLVCEKCGGVSDVESARVTRALKRAFCESSGFAISEIQLVAMGRCESCNSNKGGICQN